MKNRENRERTLLFLMKSIKWMNKLNQYKLRTGMANRMKFKLSNRNLCSLKHRWERMNKMGIWRLKLMKMKKRLRHKEMKIKDWKNKDKILNMIPIINNKFNFDPSYFITINTHKIKILKSTFLIFLFKQTLLNHPSVHASKDC